jgi:protein-tyrosine phosphatase
MPQMIERRFGTTRGLFRLLLSYPQHWAGFDALAPFDMSNVRRLVFVCRGNISRSAYAEAAAHKRGLATASCGVSAAQGREADPAAVQVASQCGLDLSGHRATEAGRFEPQPGDLILAMEVRQLAALRALPHLAQTPRLLLGSFSGAPHLHDPYGLSLPYYASCFQRIDAALDRLETLCPAARLNG